MTLKYLVVDLLVQVLDEDVALTGFAQGGITLRPHDTTVTTVRSRLRKRFCDDLPRAILDERVIKLLQSTFALLHHISNWCGVLVL